MTPKFSSQIYLYWAILVTLLTQTWKYCKKCLQFGNLSIEFDTWTKKKSELPEWIRHWQIYQFTLLIIRVADEHTTGPFISRLISTFSEKGIVSSSPASRLTPPPFAVPTVAAKINGSIRVLPDSRRDGRIEIETRKGETYSITIYRIAMRDVQIRDNLFTVAHNTNVFRDRVTGGRGAILSNIREMCGEMASNFDRRRVQIVCGTHLCTGRNLCTKLWWKNDGRSCGNLVDKMNCRFGCRSRTGMSAWRWGRNYIFCKERKTHD